MNKKVAYILILSLLISLVGCAKPIVTPTDITQTDVRKEIVHNDSDVQEDKQQDEKQSVVQEVMQQDEKRSDVQPNEVKKTHQTTNQPKTSEPKKQENSQSVQSSAVQQPPANGDVNNGYVADVLVEHPTFTTETALQSWLKGGRSNYFPDDRTQMMGTLSTNNTITYRRPAIAANTAQSDYKLEQISTYPSGNAIYFHYRSTTNPEEVLTILPQNDGLYNPNFDTYDIFVEGVTKNTEWYYFSVVDGITFYYKYIPSRKKLSFIWEQFGKVMEAGCKTVELDKTTVHQKAKQLIPFIKIEQVTINLNSDQVVK